MGLGVFVIMYMVSFNPQNALGDRLTDILRQSNKARISVLGLPGTKRKHNVKLEDKYQFWQELGYAVYDFGWVNKSQCHAGCTIAISKYVARDMKVVWVYVPHMKQQSRIVGRFGAVRLKSATHDICPIVLYLPPFTSMRNKSIYSQLLKFLDKFLARLPGRTIPMLFTDANAKVGYNKMDEEGPVLGTSTAVGNVMPNKKCAGENV